MGPVSSAAASRPSPSHRSRRGSSPYFVGPDEYAAFSDAPAGGSGCYAIAPLLVDGRWGAIAVAMPPEVAYGERELKLLDGLAHQAKLAIANASSFESLERTFLSTVEALANALEARDEYTSSHARWITDTALRVGTELGLDGDALKRLELGALFHDIGKIGIPNSILLKPGPLDDDERALIEMHPELGEKILAPIDQLGDVCSIVRACHERWDGGGLSRPQVRRGDPARGPHHLRVRRLPRDDDRPPIPQAAAGRGSAAAARRGGRDAVRPGRGRDLPPRPPAAARLEAAQRRSTPPGVKRDDARASERALSPS